jgi:hypothetical protein
MPVGHNGDPERTRVRQKAFLNAYAQCGTICHAAKAVGMPASLHYLWLQGTAEDGGATYADRFAEARRAYNDVIRREIARRAIDGLERLKFYKGMPILDPRTGQPYREREYSDQLLTLLAKSRMPDEFKDRTESKVTADVSARGDLRTVGPNTMHKLREALRYVTQADRAEQTEQTDQAD